MTLRYTDECVLTFEAWLWALWWSVPFAGDVFWWQNNVGQKQHSGGGLSVGSEKTPVSYAYSMQVVLNSLDELHEI